MGIEGDGTLSPPFPSFLPLLSPPMVGGERRGRKEGTGGERRGEEKGSTI